VAVRADLRLVRDAYASGQAVVCGFASIQIPYLSASDGSFQYAWTEFQASLSPSACVADLGDDRGDALGVPRRPPAAG
jgi:hypothetical protein